MQDQHYKEYMIAEVYKWKRKMQKSPSILDKTSKGVQNKINSVLPKQYHQLMTEAVKQMTQAVLVGSEYTACTPKIDISLQERDKMAFKLIRKYKSVAMVEGAGTGAGGILAGMADFPLLLSIKMKMLYEVAAIYGYNTKDYRERIYILSIFELAFSSQSHTNKVYERINNWEQYKYTIPENGETFDWQTFQQEYRDYLDLAKLLQMLPVVGAPVGAYVNNKLADKLGYTAMQAYRMRWLYYIK